jgi:hypothetical protein
MKRFKQLDGHRLFNSVLGVGILATVSAAQGGMFTCLPETDLPSTNYTSVLGDPAIRATVEAVLPTPNVSYTVTGGVEGDPILDIIQKTSNTTAFDWGTYELEIVPSPGSSIALGSIYVDDSSGINHPPANVYPNIATFLPDIAIDQSEHTVVFSGGPGQVVPVGQNVSVWIEFDVVGDSNGSYGYRLDNAPAPVPEPASLSLLVVGAVGLWARRRRA